MLGTLPDVGIHGRHLANSNLEEDKHAISTSLAENRCMVANDRRPDVPSGAFSPDELTNRFCHLQRLVCRFHAIRGIQTQG